MGSVNIEGLGIVEIEGNEPNDIEQSAILNALQEEDTQEPEPPIEQPEQQATEQEPQEGPLGIMPAEAREPVRKAVESQHGLVQLIMEAGPSVGGAVGGAKLGAMAGAPFFPPVGSVVGGTLGAIVGGLAGETIAQETGIAPESELNLALSAAGPLVGPALGTTFRAGRRAVGAGITHLPFAKTAFARGQIAKAVQEFESLGTKIIGKQKGIMGRVSGELYDAVRRAKVIVPSKALSGTKNAIEELADEMEVTKAFPEVKQAMNVLNQISKTLEGSDVSMDTLVHARQLVGHVVERTKRIGGIKLGSAKKVYAQISDDLDKIAADQSLTGRAARLAKAATQRAKLEFSVKDLEAGIAKHVKDVGTKEGTTINIVGIQKWLRNITNPKSKQFNKNFTDALKDELPEINNRLKELSKIVTDAGSPGGPGSLVVRGRLAKAGSVIIGGLLGAGTAGPIGAGVGAIAGARAPETITALLMSKTGAAFLEKAARFGKGQINAKAWVAAGQFATRAAGEKSEAKEIPAPAAL